MVKLQANISAISRTSIIIIPSLVRNYQKKAKGNKLLIDWIEQQYKGSAEIASMCTSTFSSIGSVTFEFVTGSR